MKQFRLIENGKEVPEAPQLQLYSQIYLGFIIYFWGYYQPLCRRNNVTSNTNYYV